MLSAYGAQVVGFYTDGGAIHPHCAITRGHSEIEVARAERGLDDRDDLSPFIRYSAESDWPEGLSCDECSEWIVEPSYDPDDDPTFRAE